MSRGDYEHDFARALLRVLRPGDTFFDVGANAGYFSLLAKLRVGTGTVVAFEPLPENIRMIRAVEAVNPNVTFDLVEGAVGAYDGEISFEVTKNNANGRLTGVTWVLAKPAIQQVVVRCVHLLPFLQKYRPAVVKLDTEGAEFTILSSLGSPSEWKGLPIFLIEFHGQENTDRCSGVLRNWGYQLFPAASCSETREIPDQYVMAVPSTRGEN
jgi:FkbM family methyltransferase